MGGVHPIRPFHWELEFPEVFAGEEAGFDAIVGNPPFAGKNTLIAGHRDHYLDWLQTLHPGAHGNADLVAHFFLRAFALLRSGACLGLIATNTIGQGDTRESGLRALIEAGGAITRATRRFPWPGEAAVVVSVVHVAKGQAQRPMLDGAQVRRISAYLVEGDLDASPMRLAANSGRAFIGHYICGAGFTFDDDQAEKGNATSTEEMRGLIQRDKSNNSRIRPYIGGAEVNKDPTQAHHRWVIDFEDFPLRRVSDDIRDREDSTSSGVDAPLDYKGPVAEDWPDLLSIVRRLVRPERSRLPPKNVWNRTIARYWWRWGAYRVGLAAATSSVDRVLFHANIGPHLAFSLVSANVIVGAPHNVIVMPGRAPFTILQSRVHEVWTRFFASSLEDRLRYSPSDCFETFPFPSLDDPVLHDLAEAYEAHRAALMVMRSEGMTKTYNRFHDPTERAEGIRNLRELHHDLDRTVLRTYGWDDLADRAAPVHLTEDDEPDHRYQGRLFWPGAFRDEVLSRLLDLNRTRAAEERVLGLSPSAAAEGEEEDPEAA